MKEIIVGLILLLFAFSGAYGCVAGLPELEPGRPERIFAGAAVFLIGAAGLQILCKGCSTKV